MGVVADMFKKPKSTFNAGQAIAAQGEQNQQAFNTNQGAYKDTFKTNFNAAKNTANPFSTSQAIIDPATGMPTGSSVGFSGQWGQGIGSVGDAFAANAGNGLMPNFDTSTVNNIMQTGMQNYDDLNSAPFQQQFNLINQDLANKGIPGDDVIANNRFGEMFKNQNLARNSFFADLYGKAPGLQSQLDQNQMYQQFAPTQAALGLGTQSMGLLQNTGTPQMGTAQMGTVDAMGAMKTQAQMEQDAKNAQMAMWGNVAKGVGSWAGGGPLGGLFNSFGGGGMDGNGN
jgi:hypothetical protein